MELSHVIRILSQCAGVYQAGLNNRNVLFVYERGHELQALETCFLPRHFLHLTGVRFSGTSSNFLRLCLEHKLSPKQISLAENGTTEMKLQVLPELVNIHQSARMIGPYDQSKIALYTEQLVGNVRGCMGFVLDGQYYNPNTVLREDIRNITVGCCRTVATYVKPIGQARYIEASYHSSAVDLMQIEQSDLFERYFRGMDIE